MTNNEQVDIFEHIFLRLQWQRFVPRHTKEALPGISTPSDPVLSDYRNNKISKAEACRYLGIHEKDLLRTLVEKGELFGD